MNVASSGDRFACVPGAGRSPSLTRIATDDATFMSCTPVNHLGTVPNPGPVGSDPGTPPSVDLRELRMMLTDALVSLEELKATVGMLSGLLASVQMRHDPLPKILELQEELRTLEVRGGNRPFTTMTLSNVRK